MDEKVNVLVMGNSGAGKSTLIDSIFTQDGVYFNKAADDNIWTGDTKSMKIYKNDNVPFCAIDTRGMEYGFLAQMQTKAAIKKWSRDSVKKGESEKYIHIIWYCIDATSKRIFDKNLDLLYSISKMWQGIPIIIVLTKSYSSAEINNNIRLIGEYLFQYNKKKNINIKDIIPVVAKPFPVNNNVIVPSMGLERLIEKTNSTIPESVRVSERSIKNLNKKVKRYNAKALIIVATASAAIIGAVPIPIADSFLLIPLQSGLIMGIGMIYKINDNEDKFKKISEVIVQSGLISVGARTLISGLKAIPGINIAMEVLNAIVAASITAILGEITITISERISIGEMSYDDLNYIKGFCEDQVKSKAEKYLSAILKNLDFKDPKSIGKTIGKIFNDLNK